MPAKSVKFIKPVSKKKTNKQKLILDIDLELRQGGYTVKPIQKPSENSHLEVIRRDGHTIEFIKKFLNL